MPIQSLLPVVRPLLLAMVCLTAGTALAADPVAHSALETRIAAQAIEEIPKDVRIGAVGIGPIDGDEDGRLGHALTAALARSGRLKVIERRDLDKLLEEQGVQTRDWIDPKERVKFGKVRGVQGLVFGRVVGRSTGWFRDTLVVQLKLDDVERGQVVFAKELTAGEWHVGALVVLAILIAGLLIALGAVLGQGRTVTKKLDLAEVDRRERTLNTEELAKAIGELGRARTDLHEKGFAAAAIRIKDLEVQLRTLRDRIALAPSGATERYSAGQLRQAVGFDQTYRTLVETVANTATNLCNHVSAGDKELVERDVQALTSHVRQAETTFRDRRP